MSLPRLNAHSLTRIGGESALAQGIFVLLLGWLCLEVARLVWLPMTPELVPLPQPVIPAKAEAQPGRVQPDTPSSTPVNFRKLALFGKKRVAPVKPVAPVTTQVRKTRLKLKLAGILRLRAPASDHQDVDQGLALIEGPDRHQKTYAIGDTLPGGATLHAVEEQRVVLKYQGRLEALPLSRSTAPGASPLATPGRGIPPLQRPFGAPNL